MNISLKNIVTALSLSLDLSEDNNIKYENMFNDYDLNHQFSNHSICTTYIALEIVRNMNLSDSQYFNVYISSMLHDIGTQNIFEDCHTSEWYIKKHCIEGSEMLQKIPSLIQIYDIVRYHHENYDGSGCLKLKKELIPIEAQILRLADLVEIHMNYNVQPLLQSNPIIEWVESQSDKIFSPYVVKAFLSISRSESFWLNLFNIPIRDFILQDIIPKTDTFISLNEFEAIADIFASIIDNKSSFTASHSKEIASLAFECASYLGYSEEKCLKIKIAVCDIYQSLIADRPYRKGLYMYEAFNILDDMASKNHICRRSVDIFKSTLISKVEVTA